MRLFYAFGPSLFMLVFGYVSLAWWGAQAFAVVVVGLMAFWLAMAIHLMHSRKRAWNARMKLRMEMAFVFPGAEDPIKDAPSLETMRFSLKAFLLVVAFAAFAGAATGWLAYFSPFAEN